jgi:pimeloyl-ACP methyl ester carboxylesterase
VSEQLEAQVFELDADGQRLRGERLGEGPSVVLAHGITATRRHVVHGSKSLARAGYRQISYDARAHGESGPAPEGSGYTYAELAADLGRVIADGVEGLPVVCGDSMGCHTAATYALQHAGELAGAVLIRPVTLGLPAPEEVIAHWDRLADGLERDGVDGFMGAYEEDLDLAPEFEQTVLRFTRERMELHRHPRALARAVREVPRSIPFEGIVELESLDLPALVVGSRDEGDPGHPYAVAEAWAAALPRARMISEETGESPLAWQGGRLSRAIAGFCERPEVAERLCS